MSSVTAPRPVPVVKHARSEKRDVMTAATSSGLLILQNAFGLLLSLDPPTDYLAGHRFDRS